MKDKLIVLCLSILVTFAIAIYTTTRYQGVLVNELLTDETKMNFYGFELLYGNERESTVAGYMDSKLIQNFNDLEKHSSYILKVTPVHRMQNAGVFNTSVEIKEVIKGNDLEIGETISVLEPVSFISNDNVSSAALYIPMLEEQEYYVFLNQMDIYKEKTYNFTDALYSKYPVRKELRPLHIDIVDDFSFEKSILELKKYDYIVLNLSKAFEQIGEVDSTYEYIITNLQYYEQHFRNVYETIFAELVENVAT